VEIDQLPDEVRTLAAAFRDGVAEALGNRLVCLLFLGSVAFPGFEPHHADIDFHGVVGGELRNPEKDALARLHARLASEHALGRLVDGSYIPLAKVQTKPPQRLDGVAEGVFRRGGANRDRGGWVLERAHLNAGAFVLLQGRDPRDIYPPPDQADLAAALDEEFHELALTRMLERHPVYSTLNLCRPVYSVEAGDVVVSKVTSAEWALTRLPDEWRALVRDALALYRGDRRAADLADLREFYRYVGSQYFTRAR
jgi:Aminoglycoside adenylyltransferase, C-terminal domain